MTEIKVDELLTVIQDGEHDADDTFRRICSARSDLGMSLIWQDFLDAVVIAVKSKLVSVRYDLNSRADFIKLT